jgi:hypothetical protein
VKKEPIFPKGKQAVERKLDLESVLNISMCPTHFSPQSHGKLEFMIISAAIATSVKACAIFVLDAFYAIFVSLV